MRTKRGGFRPAKNKPGVPRVKLEGTVKGGGDVVARPSSRRATEPLDAGLRRYLRFPIA